MLKGSKRRKIRSSFSTCSQKSEGRNGQREGRRQPAFSCDQYRTKHCEGAYVYDELRKGRNPQAKGGIKGELLACSREGSDKWGGGDFT